MGRIVLNRRESIVQITEGWMLPPSVVRVSEIEGKIVNPSKTLFTSEQVAKIKADTNTMLLFKANYLAWGEEISDTEARLAQLPEEEEGEAPPPPAKKGKRQANPVVADPSDPTDLTQG